MNDIASITSFIGKLLNNQIVGSISVVQTNTWGYMDKNGSWNGMTNSLKTNEVDIGTPMFLNPTKFKFLRYLPLFTSTT